MVDLVGQRFGRLTVLSRKDGLMRTYWMCLCDCGKETTVRTDKLKSGNTVSCGCYQKEVFNNRKHNKHKTRLYNIWSQMKQRCYNKKYTHYNYYGGYKP
jgi:hypothetical protein